MSKRIAIQGQQASYHHQAAKNFFGDNITVVPCDTFGQTFAALADGKADYVVVALENSLFGSINQTYDLLLKHKFWIMGEVFLRIEHCLIGLPGSKVADIREVHSQLEALAQCEDYLDGTLKKAMRMEHHDTAASVADVKKWNDPTKAAVASKQAAELYGMHILQKNIEDNHQNYTRFVVLQPKKSSVNEADKTSLVLKTADTAGSLFHALGAFAKHDINLSKLQSRPVIGNAWNYIFYVDALAGEQDESLKKSLSTLEDLGCEVTVLGSYRNAREHN